MTLGPSATEKEARPASPARCWPSWKFELVIPSVCTSLSGLYHLCLARIGAQPSFQQWTASDKRWCSTSCTEILCETLRIFFGIGSHFAGYLAEAELPNEWRIATL